MADSIFRYARVYRQARKSMIRPTTYIPIDAHFFFAPFEFVHDVWSFWINGENIFFIEISIIIFHGICHILYEYELSTHWYSWCTIQSKQMNCQAIGRVIELFRAIASQGSCQFVNKLCQKNEKTNQSKHTKKAKWNETIQQLQHVASSAIAQNGACGSVCE